MKRLALTWIILLFTFSLFAQKTVKIMTFNVEFMWDGVEPEEGREDKIKFAWRGDQEACEKRMAEIAKIIKRNNPDIINLVEVENENALNTLNGKFLSDQGYKPYFIKGSDGFTGQDVCMLSRYEVTDFGRVNERAPMPRGKTYGVSKNYFALMEVEGVKIALFGIHFLSVPDDECKVLKRQTQAEVIGTAASGYASRDYKVIILGDMNDYDSDPSSSDHIDSRAFTSVLEDLKSLHNNDPVDDLLNASLFVSKNKRFTSHWDRNKNGKVDDNTELTSIDHILFSKSLAGQVEEVIFDQKPLEGRVSDHYPVMLVLEL